MTWLEMRRVTEVSRRPVSKFEAPQPVSQETVGLGNVCCFSCWCGSRSKKLAQRANSKDWLWLQPMDTVCWSFASRRKSCGGLGATSTLIHLCFRRHDFCYVYAHSLQYSSILNQLKQTLRNDADGVWVWKHFCLDEQKQGNDESNTKVCFLFGSYQLLSVLPRFLMPLTRYAGSLLIAANAFRLWLIDLFSSCVSSNVSIWYLSLACCLYLAYYRSNFALALFAILLAFC